MAALRRLKRGCHSSPLFSAQVEGISGSILHRSSFSSTVLSSLVGGNGEEKRRREKGKWLTLPPFASQKDPSSVGKELVGGKLAGQEEITTALKWVHQCFPHLPMSLVQKLFRLRQGISMSRQFSILPRRTPSTAASFFQIPMPQFRATRSRSSSSSSPIYNSGLPPHSCLKNESCPVTILITGQNRSLAQSIGRNLFGSKKLEKPSDFVSPLVVASEFMLVRKNLVSSGAQCEGQQLKRVSAKDTLSSGEVILLPISVENFTKENNKKPNNQKEIKFMRSLILYKDSAIIVLNKPHGLPVQGGLGIKNSIDVLAATSLKFDCQESPKLVHRLDRDCSGLLILARTQISTSILHAIFREKTSRTLKENIKVVPRLLQRKYWALVIGTPKQSSGLLSAPIGKVILEDGKSERITVIKERPASSQHALTEYKVIKKSNGYTWLELCPLTGRKHQLRVHCAEVLRTPIVGDYKYGWHAHKKWEMIVAAKTSKFPKEKLPFGLDFESGSISEKQPRLHLHCRQMILPNIAEAGRHLEPSSATKFNLAELDNLDLVAPLPPYMVLSWNILSF